MRHALLIRISSQAGRRGPEMMVRKGRKRGREGGSKGRWKGGRNYGERQTGQLVR